MSGWRPVGPWRSGPPTSTATSCPRFTWRTTSDPIGCCIIGRGPGEFHFALLEGRKSLTTPNSKVVGRDSFKGMGVDFGDLNGDGRLDFFVSNIAAEYALEESHFVFVSTGETDLMKRGIAPYVDQSEPLGLSRSGWGWDTKLADFDNDGVLEALQAVGFAKGTTNRWPELQELAMGNDEFLKDPGELAPVPGGRRPVRASAQRLRGARRRGPVLGHRAGLGLGEPGVSRGIATADVDGDGRLDFAVANQWAASSFYRNQSRDPGTFLGLHLLLPVDPKGIGPTRSRPGHPGADATGRPALGASANVELSDGRRLVAQVDGGNGHSGKRSHDLHFGLGRTPLTTSLRVALHWRDPAGRVRHETLQLKPGWHTIVLGQTNATVD